ncbi:MAG TPA: hypothetical protein VF189_04460 [Patescibacteria group bacterium]
MKIAIIGSMSFAREMLNTKNKLEELGHTVVVPIGTEAHLNDREFVDNLDDNLAWCIENDIMRKNFKQVSENDAVLVLNNKKNDLAGYIGISALMEIGVAHFLNKKIFLMEETPHYDKVRWAHEVKIMQPVILNGDLSKVI